MMHVSQVGLAGCQLGAPLTNIFWPRFKPQLVYFFLKKVKFRQLQFNYII